MKTITSFGAYSVTESSVTGYALKSASAECSGTIAAGQTKLCVLTNDDAPATLTIVKQVVTTARARTPADFTITINGVTAAGGRCGSTPVGRRPRSPRRQSAYSGDRGRWAMGSSSASAGCSGTIALGESKTCTLVNNDA